jgi:predicted metal-binding membrane protein
MVFAFGLAFLFSILWEKRQKLTAVLLAGIFCLWNLQLIVQFATGMMDRSRLDIVRSAKIAVTVLPEKIVHIGRKFFTDRDDLYKIKDKKNKAETRNE